MAPWYCTRPGMNHGESYPLQGMVVWTATSTVAGGNNVFFRFCRLFLLVVLLGCCGRPAMAGVPTEPSLLLTESRFRRVACMDEASFRYYRGIIRALSYTQMRAFRAFCSLPGITAEEAISVLQRLVFFPLTFDQIPLLEQFVGLPGTTVDACWDLLARTSSLEFAQQQAVKALGTIRNATAVDILFLADEVKRLDEDGYWAAEALFSVRLLNGSTARQGVAALGLLEGRQLLAAERACRIADISAEQVLVLFSLLRGLSAVDAANCAALMAADGARPDTTQWWLENYFTQTDAEKAVRFHALTVDQKSTLLAAFSAGSRFLIRDINNLHAVTDRFGAEIRTAALIGGDPVWVRSLFDVLHPAARLRHQAAFHRALADGRRSDAAEVLKQATALARRLTAEDLSTANIYVLLAHGSELFDSSFRDILAPVLLKRISISHGEALLSFFAQIDPEHRQVSDFIVSCAQKGKLTSFFPRSEVEQKAVLDLVVASALNNEQSLILFAATFETLLETLQAEVRSHLVNRIVAAIDKPDTVFARQLRVILQFYRHKYPELLGQGDQDEIDRVIGKYGIIDLTPFTRTDFRRWKQDGALSSLSIFQNDDDGQLSYLSNSRHLISNGYRPQLSERLDMLSAGSQSRQRSESLIDQERSRPGSALAALYKLSVAEPLVVEWVKQVNGLRLSHAVAVYQNPERQKQLLKRFIDHDIELFAQRGHSYWREEQLLEPMRQLLEKKEISPAAIGRINRFMSIGSCGGLRVYSELNQLFNNTVDIFATVGTGKALVNDPYNQRLFEIIAVSGDQLGWDDIARQSAAIFARERASDYLQPGSLPAILHKMMDVRQHQ